MFASWERNMTAGHGKSTYHKAVGLASLQTHIAAPFFNSIHRMTSGS